MSCTSQKKFFLAWADFQLNFTKSDFSEARDKNLFICCCRK